MQECSTMSLVNAAMMSLSDNNDVDQLLHTVMFDNNGSPAATGQHLMSNVVFDNLPFSSTFSAPTGSLPFQNFGHCQSLGGRPNGSETGLQAVTPQLMHFSVYQPQQQHLRPQFTSSTVNYVPLTSQQQQQQLVPVVCQPVMHETQRMLIPPRKPLSPYMTFSKEIWPQVKAMTNNGTVCEIGATIGRMWRELDDATKQQYNNAFVARKQRYDEELQEYLNATGLHASDLVKPPKSRKKCDVKSTATVAASNSVSTVSCTVTSAVNSCVTDGTRTTVALPVTQIGFSYRPVASMSATSHSNIPVNAFSMQVPVPGVPGPSPGVSLPPPAPSSNIPVSKPRPATVASRSDVDMEDVDLQSQVVELRNVLSQRTLEAQLLMRQLETANRVVSELTELCQMDTSQQQQQQQLGLMQHNY